MSKENGILMEWYKEHIRGMKLTSVRHVINNFLTHERCERKAKVIGVDSPACFFSMPLI